MFLYQMQVLSVGSLATACNFLAPYGLGCVSAMTVATIFIGQGTATLTQNTDFDLTVGFDLWPLRLLPSPLLLPKLRAGA